MAGDKGVAKSSGTEDQLSHVHAPVFISYASQDAAIANTVVENLEQDGSRCWIAPRDVKPGALYADAIVRAINEAKVVVLVMSGSAVASSHVGREIERAASKHRQIIAFRIDAAGLNHALEYFLSQSQWIDVPQLGMPAALARLKDAVGQGAAPSSQSAPSRRVSGVGKRVGFAAAVLIAVCAVVGVGWHYWSSSRTAAQSTVAMADKSIAVLPFADMSEKKDQEYFGDGMAEEIIDRLAKVPVLRVTGRTSSFQFKGRTEDLRSIARQLGVAFVLEGSVRRSGDRMRVTAQLIDSRNGSPRWSQTYDRDFSDVLRLQDEIATKVVRLVENDAFYSEYVSRKSLRSPEAYTAYLQGQYAKDRSDQPGLEQAISDFQRALDLDPAFADAAVALADTYVDLGGFGFMARAEALEKGRLAAELALKLDPHLEGAHAELGFIHLFYDWDWAAAEQEFKLAGFGPPPQLSMTLGRAEDALKAVNAALASDPLEPSNYFWLGFAQLRRGRLPEAEAAMRRTLELSPAYTFAHYNLALVLLARGERDAALLEVLKEPSDPSRFIGSALAYYVLGRKAESDAALAQYIKGYADYSASGVATVYAFRGESDEAFKWLDRAYVQKDPFLYGIKYRTEFDKLHDDPRYKAFLKKMNLPE